MFVLITAMSSVSRLWSIRWRQTRPKQHMERWGYRRPYRLCRMRFQWWRSTREEWKCELLLNRGGESRRKLESMSRWPKVARCKESAGLLRLHRSLFHFPRLGNLRSPSRDTIMSKQVQKSSRAAPKLAGWFLCTTGTFCLATRSWKWTQQQTGSSRQSQLARFYFERSPSPSIVESELKTKCSSFLFYIHIHLLLCQCVNSHMTIWRPLDDFKNETEDDDHH